MKKNLATFLSIISLSLVAACGGGANAAGTYELDKASFKEQMLGMMPEEAKKDMAMVDKMMEGMSGSIELKADGTAAMAMKMPPFLDDKTDGTWKMDGDKVSITTKKGDKDDTKTASLANGVITIEEEQGGKKMKMTFKKK